MNDAMGKLNLQNARDSFNRPPASPGALNRNSTSDAQSLPDAVAAIAVQKAKISAQGGAPSGSKSNRNSAIFDRSSLQAPSLAGGSKENNPPASPWNQSNTDRPKSSGGGMGNFQLPQPPSAGLRSPRHPPPQITGNTNIQTTTLQAPTGGEVEMPQLSPYGGASSGNWASMVNTPVNAMFPQSSNAEMVANATAMKLAALSTVNNRIILDNDPKGWGKRRSKDGGSSNNGSSSHSNGGFPSPRPNGQMPPTPSSITMYNEHGQLVQIPAAAAAAALAGHQNPGSMLGGRSRPNSPGVFGNAGSWPAGMGFASPQAGGFLAASSPLLSNGLLGQFGNLGSEGYQSDEVSGRGRSPRGRRGSSKPPEDPTNPELLNDIPSWLRSLRLHKYTDNLKDMQWKDLVQLDDDALEKRGVNALGARRKMLKVRTIACLQMPITNPCPGL